MNHGVEVVNIEFIVKRQIGNQSKPKLASFRLRFEARYDPWLIGIPLYVCQLARPEQAGARSVERGKVVARPPVLTQVGE